MIIRRKAVRAGGSFRDTDKKTGTETGFAESEPGLRPEYLLESRDFPGLLIAVEYDVPSERNHDEPENPVQVVGDSQIAAREKGRVLPEHGPQQR